MALPRSRKDREQQKFVDDGSGNVAVRAVVIGGGGGGGGTPGGANDSLQYRINGTTFGGMTGVNSDGDTIILDNGTFLKTIDKDDNEINIAGYLGELLFIGDLQFGNQLALGSAQIDGTTSEVGFSALGTDGFSTSIRKEDATDPDNPVLIESYEEQASYTGAESRYENGGESFFGFEYLYGNYSQVVSDNQTILDFRFEGHNDGLSRVEYAGRKIEATLRELGNERGTIIDQVVINGTMTDAMRIGDGGSITLKLLPQFDAQLAGSGVAYAAFETSLNSGTYAYQFGAGTTVPTDATVGWSGGAIFGDADATPNTYNRMWLNTGTSSSSAFRRIAIVENTNQMAMADGTAAAPFYSFPTSPTTGMYLPLVNTLGFATNGTVKMQINSNSNVQFSVPTSFSSATPPSSATYGHGRVGSTVLQANAGSGGSHQMSVNGQTRFSVNNIGELTNVEDGITASATQTQGQRPLLFSYNIVTVVATIDDVVTLPTAVAGQIVRIKNEGVHKLQVFPATGDSINNGTVNASDDQNPNTFYMYIADDATNWTRVQMTIA
jgi:hypothetical protein